MSNLFRQAYFAATKSCRPIGRNMLGKTTGASPSSQGCRLAKIIAKTFCSSRPIFNSFALVQALTAVQTTEPAREPEALRAFQKARYEEGLDTAKLDVLADVLRQIGCQQAVRILKDRATEQLAKQRIADGANLAQQFGVSGVPFVVEETGQGWRQIRTESLW